MKKIAVFIFLVMLNTFVFSKDIGLVLSGGGAKGAYEVGVWRALNDYGLDKDIKIISGTSVGALNAALFACTTAKKSEELWRTVVGYETFLMPDANSVEAFISSIARNISAGINETDELYGDESESQDNSLKLEMKKIATATGLSFFNIVDTLGQQLLEYTGTDNHSTGLFERESLQKMLDSYVNVRRIKASNYKIYATTIRKSMLRRKALANALIYDYDSTETFLLNEQPSDYIARQILLASSALPLVYSSQPISAAAVINGTPINRQYEYIDGGFSEIGGQNTPYKPVLKSNVDTVIVVYLKSRAELMEEDIIPNAYLGRKRLIEIIPSKDLGTMLTGTVNFSESKIQELIELGYKDACEVIKSSRLQ